MRTLILLPLLAALFVGSAASSFSQLSPNQALANASSYQSLSDQGLRVVTAYGAAVMAGLGLLTPSQALSVAAGYQSLDDHSLAVIAAYGMANALSSGSTNSIVFQVTNSFALTNVSLVGFGSSYSNGVASTGANGAGVDGIGLRPFGGDYYGVIVSNSPTISATNEQAAMGFPVGQTMPSSTMTFYDSRFVGVGAFGDAVSFKYSGATNRVRFYSSLFQSQNFCFNQVGIGFFDFYDDDFQAIGNSGVGAVVGYAPDQGPNTNRLFGCKFTAKGSALTVAFLMQIQSYTWMSGCQFDLATTNAAHEVTGIGFSGEANYIGVLNSCHFHLEGPGTNFVADWTFAGVGAGNPCTVVFNDCYIEGANGASGLSGKFIKNDVSPAPTIVVSGGNIKASMFTSLTGVSFINEAWETPTNSMTGQSITLGQAVYTNCSAALTFTGLGNTADGNNERSGRATLFSNGADRTIVTPASWHCSDFVSTRTLTNGNTMVLTANVTPGISTNVAIAQFK